MNIYLIQRKKLEENQFYSHLVRANTKREAYSKCFRMYEEIGACKSRSDWTCTVLDEDVIGEKDVILSSFYGNHFDPRWAIRIRGVGIISIP